MTTSENEATFKTEVKMLKWDHFKATELSWL